ncbi:MAG: hemerythrin domain-containing protein [Moraxellaceae bacterium]|nr:MAG: hemerythrin domain-containing protein [Moraxellaceae bacterium]
MSPAAKNSSQLLAFPLSTEATSILRADQKFVKILQLSIKVNFTVFSQEIFYPAIKKSLKAKTLITEAAVEHETLKYLIAQVQGKEPDGELYDARVKLLGEYVARHAKQEQNEIFPRARQTKVDMISLGEQLVKRRQELTERLYA